ASCAGTRRPSASSATTRPTAGSAARCGRRGGWTPDRRPAGGPRRGPQGVTAVRAAWTRLTDRQLLEQCAVDNYRASRPRGPKPNRTSSAVRLRHPPSGLAVIAEESRSQHENRARALARLRQALFLQVREPLNPAELAPEALAERDGYRGARDP